MSDVARKNTNAFARFWPFPGLAILFLLAAWLFYMGTITEVEDAKTAFYGLGGVTTFLLLLGLRKRRAQKLREAERETKELPAGDFANRLPRRSSIPDPDETDKTPAVTAAAAPSAALPEAGLPRNARQRAIEARNNPPAEPEPSEAEKPKPNPANDDPPPAAVVAPLARVGAAASASEEPKAAAKDDAVPALATDAPLAAPFDAKTAMSQLEALFSREKAERGAQIAKLEAAVAAAGGAVGDGETTALDERLKQYLTIPAFNNAMNQKVFPRIEQALMKSLDEAMKPEVLREKLGQDGGEGGGAGDASLRQEVSAHKESSEAEYGRLREEIEGARRLAERAVSMVNESADGRAAPDGASVAALRAALSEDRSEINALRETIDKLTGSMGAGASGGGEGSAALGAMEQTLSALRADVEKLSNDQASLSRRIDEISGAGANQAAGAEAGEQSEVNALRDALTTIIAQNHEIRAQQDMLTARFDPPSRGAAGTSDTNE
ncbi:MAG: hypothetical protein AAGB11_07935 [Pseudomonadota bacterium]